MVCSMPDVMQVMSRTGDKMQNSLLRLATDDKSFGMAMLIATVALIVVSSYIEYLRKEH